jgi:hypothetical protein
VKTWAVWYFDCIVRGPFADKKSARAAMKDCGGAREKLKVAEYDPASDAQTPGWTHPSVLLMTWRHNLTRRASV